MLPIKPQYEESALFKGKQIADIDQAVALQSRPALVDCGLEPTPSQQIDADSFCCVVCVIVTSLKAGWVSGKEPDRGLRTCFR